MLEHVLNLGNQLKTDLETSEGFTSVDYEKIVPLLIESIKELKDKVEHIEKKCDCLNK